MRQELWSLSSGSNDGPGLCWAYVALWGIVNIVQVAPQEEVLTYRG